MKRHRKLPIKRHIVLVAFALALIVAGWWIYVYAANRTIDQTGTIIGFGDGIRVCTTDIPISMCGNSEIEFRDTNGTVMELYVTGFSDPEGRRRSAELMRKLSLAKLEGKAVMLETRNDGEIIEVSAP